MAVCLGAAYENRLRVGRKLGADGCFLDEAGQGFEGEDDGDGIHPPEEVGHADGVDVVVVGCGVVFEIDRACEEEDLRAPVDGVLGN